MPRSKVNTFYYFIDILAYKNFIQNSSKYIGENQPWSKTEKSTKATLKFFMKLIFSYRKRLNN